MFLVDRKAKCLRPNGRCDRRAINTKIQGSIRVHIFWDETLQVVRLFFAHKDLCFQFLWRRREWCRRMLDNLSWFRRYDALSIVTQGGQKAFQHHCGDKWRTRQISKGEEEDDGEWIWFWASRWARKYRNALCGAGWVRKAIWRT